MLKSSKERILFILGAAVIAAVLLQRLDVFNRIYIIGDEFGYWANASNLVGLDWTSVASNNPYYSFGYSLLLSLLFFLKTPEAMYKAAIVLNSFFMIGTFALIYSSAKFLLKDVSSIVLGCVSLSITLYSNNIFSAETTQCETLLIFIFTLIFWCLCKYVQSGKDVYVYLSVLFSCCMYYVHMRSVGIIISISICAFLILAKNKNWKGIVGAALFVGIIMVSYNFFKANFIDDVYLNNSSVAINDYSGRIKTVASVFSLRGISNFLISLLGKVFYLGTSTFFLFYWCVILLVKKFVGFIRAIRNKEDINREYFLWIFMILSLGAIICISAVSTMNQSRNDMLFYGRYNEMIIVPVLLLGIVELIHSKSRLSKLIIMFVLQLGLALLTYNITAMNGAELTYGNNMSVLASLALNSDGKYLYDFFTVVATLKAIIITIVCVIFINLSNKNKIFLSIAILCLGLSWEYYGVKWADSRVVNFQSDPTDRELTDLVRTEYGESDINELNCYTYQEENITLLHFDFVQYLLPEYKVNVIEIESDDDIRRGEYFIIDKSSEIMDMIKGECKIIKDSTNFYLCEFN